MNHISSHIVLFVIASVATINISFAQTYSMIPKDTFYSIGTLEDLETLSFHQINISSKAIVLKWKKISANIPSNWEASVCDNSICNTTLVDSGMMNPIDTGDYGLLLIHITPHVNYGTAVIRYAIWDIANADMKDTLTYVLVVSASSKIERVENVNTLNIYPNPSNGDINLVSNLPLGFEFIVTDILGKVMLKGTSVTNSIRISTKEIPSGEYNITFLDSKSTKTSKKILIQH